MARSLKTDLAPPATQIYRAAKDLAVGSGSTVQERVALPVTHVVQSAYSHWPHKRAGINPLQQARPS